MRLDTNATSADALAALQAKADTQLADRHDRFHRNSGRGLLTLFDDAEDSGQMFAYVLHRGLDVVSAVAGATTCL